ETPRLRTRRYGCPHAMTRDQPVLVQPVPPTVKILKSQLHHAVFSPGLNIEILQEEGTATERHQRHLFRVELQRESQFSIESFACRKILGRYESAQRLNRTDIERHGAAGRSTGAPV